MREINRNLLFEIDTTPEAVATLATVKAGISAVGLAHNPNVEKIWFMDGQGLPDNYLIAKDYAFSFTGKRIIGDTAQDYIFSKFFSLGDDVKTNYKFTMSNGDILEGECIIVINSGPDGSADASSDFTVDILPTGGQTFTPAP